MKIGFDGKPGEQSLINIGYVGCGGHSRRNILPALKYASARLIAVCDTDITKAELYRSEFGFKKAYTDYIEMIEKERLDAVFVVVGYDKNGRPLYPAIAKECIKRGLHVWVEKPPAASVAELIQIRELCEKYNRQFVTGFKKMYFPANEKAMELSCDPSFGKMSLIQLRYPQYIPSTEEFAVYLKGSNLPSVRGFLDHICHPISLLLYLAGMPKTLYYERSFNGAGVALFGFESGLSAVISLTHLASSNGGMENTVILSEKGGHITVENNRKVTLHRDPPGLSYGQSPTYFTGKPEQAAAVWEPEFSLGQLYNNGLFLLGYYGEIEEFAQSIINNHPVAKAGINDAINTTRIFEAFMRGPGKKEVL